MSIGSVVQQGNTVIIRDERGRQLGMIFAMKSQPSDGLIGYTGSTVSVRKGSNVITYDERGQQLGTAFAPTRQGRQRPKFKLKHYPMQS